MTTVCSICSRPATYGPIDDVMACEACKERIAFFASLGDRAIWSHLPIARGGVAAQFKEQVSETLAEDDAESHAKLAEAYRSMALYDDARREAATALRSARTKSLIESLLRMLLSEPLMQEGGFLRLRARILARPA